MQCVMLQCLLAVAFVNSVPMFLLPICSPFCVAAATSGAVTTGSSDTSEVCEGMWGCAFTGFG